MSEKNIKIRLTKAMNEAGVKIPALSKATGIPKDRIYKWYQLGTNPKPEDIILLEEWINAHETGHLSGIGETEDKGLRYDVMENKALINLLLLELAKLKAKVNGISITAAIDELEQNAKIALRQIEKSL